MILKTLLVFPSLLWSPQMMVSARMILESQPYSIIATCSGTKLCRIPCSALVMLVFLYRWFKIGTILSAAFNVMLRRVDFCFLIFSLTKRLFIAPFILLYFRIFITTVCLIPDKDLVSKLIKSRHPVCYCRFTLLLCLKFE